MQPIRPAFAFIPQAAAAAEPPAAHPDRLEAIRLLDDYANADPALAAQRGPFANALKQCLGNPHNPILNLMDCIDTEIQTCPQALSERFLPLLSHQLAEVWMPHLSADPPLWVKSLEGVKTLFFQSVVGASLTLHDAKLSETLRTVCLHAFLPCTVTVRPSVTVIAPHAAANPDNPSLHTIEYLLPTPRLVEAPPNPFSPREVRRAF